MAKGKGKKAAPVETVVVPEGEEPVKKKAKADPTDIEAVLKSQEGLLYRGRSAPKLVPEVLRTGIYGVDREVTGIGGLPRGRIVEVVGNQSSGKTTFCLTLIARAQADGHQVAFIDAEHALDGAWAEARGVNIDELIIGKPNWGEQALELLEALICTFKIALIVVDSVAALVPKKELEGEMGDSHMGLHARLMSQAMRKLVGLVEKSNTCVVFTNQYRKGMSAFGSTNEPTGGGALKFYSAIRIETTNVGKIKVGDAEDAEVLGNEIRITGIKNKMAPPWRVAKVPLLYTTGYDNVGYMFEQAFRNNLDCVQKKNNVTWSIFGENVSGKANAIERARSFEDELRINLDNFYNEGLQG
jgi:recombination protein RecA